MVLPVQYRRSFSSLDTDEDGIVLIVLDHPDWDEPRRYASDGPEEVIDADGQLIFGVTSGGYFYQHAIKFTSAFPSDRPNALGVAEIVLENVELETGDLVNSETVSVHCTVSLSAVAKSAPDDVLAGPYTRFKAKVVEAGDAETLLEIGPIVIENERANAFDMDKHLIPGLHP